jgi:hypothetical protein
MVITTDLWSPDTVDACMHEYTWNAEENENVRQLSSYSYSYSSSDSPSTLTIISVQLMKSIHLAACNGKTVRHHTGCNLTC